MNEEKKEDKQNINEKGLSIELYQDIEWLAISKHIHFHYSQLKGENIFNLNQK